MFTPRVFILTSTEEYSPTAPLKSGMVTNIVSVVSCVVDVTILFVPGLGCPPSPVPFTSPMITAKKSF